MDKIKDFLVDLLAGIFMPPREPVRVPVRNKRPRRRR